MKNKVFFLNAAKTLKQSSGSVQDNTRMKQFPRTLKILAQHYLHGAKIQFTFWLRSPTNSHHHQPVCAHCKTVFPMLPQPFLFFVMALSIFCRPISWFHPSTELMVPLYLQSHLLVTALVPLWSNGSKFSALHAQAQVPSFLLIWATCFFFDMVCYNPSPIILLYIAQWADPKPILIKFHFGAMKTK